MLSYLFNQIRLHTVDVDIIEATEDIALVKAIAQGENTEPVSREAIFKILSQ